MFTERNLHTPRGFTRWLSVPKLFCVFEGTHDKAIWSPKTVNVEIRGFRQQSAVVRVIGRADRPLVVPGRLSDSLGWNSL